MKHISMIRHIGLVLALYSCSITKPTDSFLAYVGEIAALYRQTLEKPEPQKFELMHKIWKIYRKAQKVAPEKGVILANLFDQLQKEEITRAQEFLLSIQKTTVNKELLEPAIRLALEIGEGTFALTLCDRLLPLHPNSDSLLSMKANALALAGHLAEAVEHFRLALAKSPNNQKYRLSLARTLMQQGKFKESLEQFAATYQGTGRVGKNLQAMVDTGQLHGKTIVITSEGCGLGDTLQFIRYANLLHDQGAQIIALVQKPLIPLLSRCPYLKEVATCEKQGQYKQYQQVDCMYLPVLMRSVQPTPYWQGPYLYPDPELVAYWQEKLAHDSGFKIGLCWHSGLFNALFRPAVERRSIRLESLYPLASLPGVSLYSLQQQEGTEQLESIPETIQIHSFKNIDKEHGAFMDTAAIIMNLDLVITVDSAILHLAGALGKPAWVLHPYLINWRWQVDQTGSFWYPSLRRFQQPRPFAWADVVYNVIEELKLSGYTNYATSTRSGHAMY